MYAGMFEDALEERGPDSAASVVHELARVTQGSRIQMGPLADVHFENDVTAVELDQFFDDVMARDVDWHRSVDQAAAAAPRSDFKLRVREILRTAHLYVPGSHDSPVSLDVEVNGFKFDLGFFNGRQNVVEVADIEQVHTENQIAEKAGATIVKFEVLGVSAGRIALLSGKRKAGKGFSPIVEKLVSVSDAVYFMGESQERLRFVKYVKDAVSPTIG